MLNMLGTQMENFHGDRLAARDCPKLARFSSLEPSMPSHPFWLLAPLERSQPKLAGEGGDAL